MGTRHLTAVVIDGQFKVAQYGQWDGYPDYTGRKILEFLEETNLEAFAGAVRNCTFISYEEVSRKDLETHPQMSRNTGSDVLQLINEHNGLELFDRSDFAGDSLFCEWAYVIDLDHMQFEVYKGFNQEPPLGRFADLAREGEDYKPVTLVKTYDLDELPTLEAFLEEFSYDADA